jgi:hypothetical protein
MNLVAAFCSKQIGLPGALPWQHTAHGSGREDGPRGSLYIRG